MNLKHFIAALAIIVIASCSADQEDNPSTDQQAIEDLFSEEFAYSNVGIYNGVFTTNNGEIRGNLQISIPVNNETLPKVVLSTSNGDYFEFTALTSVVKGEKVENLVFASDIASFHYSVEADGTNPLAEDLIYDGEEGSIVLGKHTNLAPVTPIVGTYNCIECGTHPILNNSVTQTFNMLSFSNDSGESSIVNQVTLGGNVFMGMGDQTNCVDNGSIRTCDTSGSFSAGSAPIHWTGTHTLNNEVPGIGDCSEASGTWLFNSANYGDLSGIYTSSATCTTPGAILESTNDLWKLNGFVDAPSPNATYYDDVMDEVNGDIETWSNHNYFYASNEYAYFKCYRGSDTSSGSSNPRVEFRELDGNGNNVSWNGDNGSHIMSFTVKVDQLPNGYNSNTGQERTSGTVCFAQIHGPSGTNNDGVDVDDTIRIQFDGDRGQTNGEVSLKISGYITEEQGGGSESIDGFALNTSYDMQLRFINDRISLVVDGIEVFGRVMDTSGDGSYFKIGSYLQSVQNGSFDDSFGLVGIKNLEVVHEE